MASAFEAKRSASAAAVKAFTVERRKEDKCRSLSVPGISDCITVHCAATISCKRLREPMGTAILQELCSRNLLQQFCPSLFRYFLIPQCVSFHRLMFLSSPSSSSTQCLL